MSSAYRPSWMPPVDERGAPTPFRPALLVCLLLVNAAFVATVGYLVGAGDAGTAAGVKHALVWPIPYLVASLLGWWGVDEFGYGLARGLALGGALLWGGLLSLFSGMGNLSEGSHARSDSGVFSGIALALLAFHALTYYLAHDAAVRMRGASPLKWTGIGFACALAWLFVALGV